MSAEFDRYAGDYEDLLKDPIRDRFARAAEFFHLRKWLLLSDYLRRRRLSPAGMRWLDIGCGKGELLRLGGPAFEEAVGCDPSEEMLKEAGGLKMVHQPQPTVLPFADAAFGLVTLVCVYHHLARADRLALTREAARVLAPGGTLAVFEHNPWNPATRLIVSRTPVDANAVLLRPPEVGRLMEAAGLSPLKTAYYLYFPERLYPALGGIERFLAWLPAGGQYAVFGGKAAGSR